MAQIFESVARYRARRTLRADFMQPLPPDDLLQDAFQHHQAGRLAEAENIYRQILAQHSDHPDALHLLGLIHHTRGRHDAAADLIQKAIALKPQEALYHCNLGIVCRSRGQLDDAIAALSKAIELKPDYSKALANLGDVMTDQGKPQDAMALYAKAVQFDPNSLEAYRGLTNALRAQGRFDEALAACSKALRLDPTNVAVHIDHGNVLRAQGKSDEAAAAYAKAIQLKPECAEAYNNLGAVLIDQGKLDEAAKAHAKAIELKPDYPNALSNLGRCYKDQGRLDEAIECYKKAIAIKATEPKFHSNLIYTLHFHPGYDSQAILREQKLWDERHGRPLRDVRRDDRDRSFKNAGSRLRIGYVSPDFRNHVIGRNILPLLREHDRREFEIFCYADVMRPDELTARFRSYADSWRDTTGVSHDQLAEQIRNDRIDILVDLALHMAHNRLPVFARKPAPVQVTFAGYPGGTGLSSIDYRLTDLYLDPPGVTDADYVEKSIRLPDSFWCYDPAAMSIGLESAPELSPLPELKNGHITFGCLNNFCKINEQVLVLWLKVLKAVKNSRLILLTQIGSHRQRTLDRFALEGVEASHIEFLPNASRGQYMNYYHRIDIGLDTLPYNGHTTSLDSFWMGVPVVTLIGATVAGRAGFSQLTNLGLSELVARSPEQYVQTIKALAEDLPRLIDLRGQLRERMLRSPLTDARRFARSVEGAYENMWRTAFS